MKRIIQGLLVLGFVFCYSAGVTAYTGTYTPGEGINNTPHDLPRGDNGMNYQPVTNPPDTLNRICIYCHAPHNTYRLAGTPGLGPEVPDSAFDYLPLWNHTLQSDISYTMYDNGPGAPQAGPKASQAILNGMVPGSTSLLCLSCHDGSVAVNEYGNDEAQLAGSVSHGTDTISTFYRIGEGKYLGNHHPIGFSYTDAQSGDPNEIRDSSTPYTVAGETIQDHLYGTTNTLECGSCHSVHNKGNTGETLLWRSDQNSELCLTCHDKGLYTSPL